MLRRRTAPPDPALRRPRTTALPMLFAALAGAASVFSFAPFGWWPLEILALAFLFYQVGMDTNVRRSTLLGWAFGFGWSVAGTHWLYITMNLFGSIPGPLAAGAVCLLGVYMGLFAALATGVSTWLRRRFTMPVTSFLFLVLPFAWGVTEWMRGWVVTGFPWVASGYAQNNSPLAGYAPLVGVYGIGVLVALCAGAIAMLTQRKRALGAGVLAVTLTAGFGLSGIGWTHPQGKPISVRLVQGNIAQDEKFDPDHVLQAMDQYYGLLTAAPADLIALPETAITLLPVHLPPGYLDSYKQYAARSGSYVMFGIPLSDGPGKYANSVAAYSPAGQAYRFDKQHLVPFGEFVPYGFRWFVTLMRIPLGEMTRGPEVQAPFAVKDQLVLPNVCYEDAFGEEIALQLRHAAQPATMLLNVSNLAWFGESIAIPQHLQMSQMRTLETGRPMLRATNSGATAVIDGRGKLVGVLPYYRQGTLAAQVQGMAGMTPFIRFGNYTMLALAALALLAAAFSGRKYGKSRQK
jgi:apolipoprotein N-acyltransferase